MISLEYSRNGEATARVKNIYFHSKYSPSSEAEKYYNSFQLSGYSTFILIEPGMNYISDVIRKNNSTAKIICIHFDSSFYQNNQVENKYLFDGDAQTFLLFLKSALKETDLGGLKIFDWPASLRIFEDNIKIIRQIISQHIRELHGNITTTSGFGKKIILNTIRNYISNDFVLVPERINSAVLITGSGPGLRDSAEFIKENRDYLYILALPSSVTFLREIRIEPDIILTTDPGYYASLHLSDFLKIPVAAPFSANIPHDFFGRGILPLNQNSFIERALLSDENTFYNIPSNGTVAGSALHLSIQLSDGPVLFSGVDFSYIDLCSHIRPHTFDTLIDKKADRLNPIPNIYFSRNILNSERLDGFRRTNYALKTYAGWFASVSKLYSYRCFFLNFHGSPPGNFRSLNYEEASLLLAAAPEFKFKKSKSPVKTERIKSVSSFINNCLTFLIKIKSMIEKEEYGSDIFNLINNEIIYNLYLPDLLEFKRFYFDKTGKVCRDKAVTLIGKTKQFLENIDV